jgi:hypothetical protein
LSLTPPAQQLANLSWAGGSLVGKPVRLFATGVK